jgi:hypothetical protein
MRTPHALLFVATLLGCIRQRPDSATESAADSAPSAADTGTAPAGDDSTPAADTVSHCTGSDPGQVPEYPAYTMVTASWSNGDVDDLNWAWTHGRSVAVNIDVASFAGTALDHAIIPTVEQALQFWDLPGADVHLHMGDTDLHCCTEEGQEDCRACGEGDGYLDVFLVPGADAWGLPAYTQPTLGDDPTSSADEQACLVGSDVSFFAAGTSADGLARPVRYAWVERGEDVRDTDDSDGAVDKPFYDTLVHELGHVLGLGEQSDPSVACSVMAHCADTSCGCNFDTIGPVDAAAMVHLYGEPGEP